jgi:hypothetical protein
MRKEAAFPIATDVPVAELVRRTAADVSWYGAVVLIGRRGPQIRHLRRLQAALRAAGYQPHYFSADAGPHLLTVEPPGQKPSQALVWWGPSS